MNTYPPTSVYANPLTAKTMHQHVRSELENVCKRFRNDPRPGAMSRALADIDTLRILSHLWWVMHEATGKPVALKPLEKMARAIRREELRAVKNPATGKLPRPRGFRATKPDIARQDLLRTFKQIEEFLASRHTPGEILASWTDYAAGTLQAFGVR